MSSDSDSKKRPIESSTSTSPPIKRKKPLQELSDSGPLTQEDVVYFQKEAIWRQMILYRQQVSQLRRDIKSLQSESSKSNKIVGVLSGWYDQIIALFAEAELEASAFGEGLLVAFQDPENVENELKSKREKLSKLISHKLSINSEEKIAELSQELAKNKSTNEQLTLENKKLNDKLDQLKEKILKLTNEITRSQSKTLKRVYDIGKAEESDLDTTPEVKEQTPNGNQDVKKEPTAEIDQEETEKLMSEIEKFKSANQILTDQVSQLTQSNQEVTAKSLELEHKLHNLTESDLDSNIHYKKIVKNNQALQEQIGKLSKLNSSNITKLNDLEKNQINIKTAIEKEILDENENLRNQLHKSEQDLVRIRTIRDELLSKNSILTSQLEDQKTNDELMSLNKALSARIELLISEKHDIAESPDDKSHELSKEELIAKVHQLNQEIKEIEAAFKSTREMTLKKLENTIDQENLVKKLTIEKNKADQKYFASMRLKDSIQQENKLLKVQVNKSQELIKNLNELEKQYLSKIEILTKSLADYKMIKENSIQENQKLQDSVRSLNTVKESLDQEIARNKQSLEKTNKQLTAHQSTINKQSLDIDKLEKELKLAESLLQKYKTNNTNSILQEDEQQLEALRSIAKCSVCSKNWKDTAITVCGHVFCNNCTQERLAARLRRCPSCNKGFSANDLLSIHL